MKAGRRRIGWWAGPFPLPPVDVWRGMPQHVERATSEQPPLEGPRVVVVGGSYFFGLAITDHETMAWQLQEADRRRRYANFGVGAYGTYQSLLALQRVFSGDDPPAWVIYGFIDHHKTRNVGRSAWLRLLSRYSRYYEVTLPYCSLDDSGKLMRHAPARYPAWPLRNSLAIVNLFFDTITDALNAKRFRQRQKVAELLLLEMYQLCHSNGAKLIVALVDSNEPRNPAGDRGSSSSGASLLLIADFGTRAICEWKAKGIRTRLRIEGGYDVSNPPFAKAGAEQSSVQRCDLNVKAYRARQQRSCVDLFEELRRSGTSQRRSTRVEAGAPTRFPGDGTGWCALRSRHGVHERGPTVRIHLKCQPTYGSWCFHPCSCSLR